MNLFDAASLTDVVASPVAAKEGIVPNTDKCFSSALATINLEDPRVLGSLVPLGIICLVVIAGNLMVMAAVKMTHKLRGATYQFIVSLAWADLTLGVVVLPFSAMYEVFSIWIFGKVWCTIWLAVDVWVCTASILHLVVISLDRYIAVTRPIAYPNIMTTKRARLLIAGAWVLSFVICFPPLVGWNDKPYPTLSDTLLGFGGGNNTGGGSFQRLSNDSRPEELLRDEKRVTEPSLPPPKDGAPKDITPADQDKHGSLCQPQCSLNQEPGYVIYSAVGSFYAPMLVMMFFNWKIYRTATKTTKAIRQGWTKVKGVSGDQEMGMGVHRGGMANSFQFQRPIRNDSALNRNQAKRTQELAGSSPGSHFSEIRRAKATGSSQTLSKSLLGGFDQVSMLPVPSVDPCSGNLHQQQTNTKNPMPKTTTNDQKDLNKGSPVGVQTMGGIQPGYEAKTCLLASFVSRVQEGLSTAVIESSRGPIHIQIRYEEDEDGEKMPEPKGQNTEAGGLLCLNSCIHYCHIHQLKLEGLGSDQGNRTQQKLHAPCHRHSQRSSKLLIEQGTQTLPKKKSCGNNGLSKQSSLMTPPPRLRVYHEAGGSTSLTDDISTISPAVKRPSSRSSGNKIHKFSRFRWSKNAYLGATREAHERQLSSPDLNLTGSASKRDQQDRISLKSLDNNSKGAAAASSSSVAEGSAAASYGCFYCHLRRCWTKRGRCWMRRGHPHHCWRFPQRRRPNKAQGSARMRRGSLAIRMDDVNGENSDNLDQGAEAAEAEDGLDVPLTGVAAMISSVVNNTASLTASAIAGPNSSRSLQSTSSTRLGFGKRNIRSQVRRFRMETKAAKTLGIIVGCFICCWFPFFTTYLITAFCDDCIPRLAFSIIFWLGYCNSALNPFIYAMFSKDFRGAFKKILCRLFCLSPNEQEAAASCQRERGLFAAFNSRRLDVTMGAAMVVNVGNQSHS